MATTAIDAKHAPATVPHPRSAEGQWSIVFRRFRRHRLAMASLAFIAFVLVLAFLAPLIAPFERDEYNPDARFAPLMTMDEKAGKIHLLGADHLGRDFFTRLLYGARVSLTIALLVASVSSLIGVTVGVLGGYYRGALDAVLNRFMEFMVSVPTFPILLTLAAVLNTAPKSLPIPPQLVSGVGGVMLLNDKEARSVIVVMFVLIVFGWIGIARLMRGMVLSVRERDFIDATRAVGASDRRVILRHVVPNALPPIIVAFTLALGAALVAEASLSFLGLGVTDPTPTWGNMLDFTTRYILSNPWAALIPGMAVVACSLAFNFIGDGLRDALDPRLQK